MKKHLMKNINTISRCATLYREEKLADCGINGYQAPYLPELCANPGITQEQLAQKLHVNRSSVTRQLTFLEKNGFVRRVRSESDHRAIEVYPTQKAEEALPLVWETFRSWREALTAELTWQQMDTLEELLDILARRAEELE